MKVGGFSVAAGTGGIDGAFYGIGIGPSNSSDDTKIRYDGAFGPVEVGVSFTPNDENGGGNSSTDNGSFQDLVEAGVVFSPDLGDGFDITASIVGGVGDDNGGDQDFETIFAGATAGFAGFNFGAGFGSEDWGGSERDWFNVGVGAAFGGVNASVTYGYNDVEPDGGRDSEPQDLAISADTGLMPGVSLGGDLHFFDNDTGGDDDGVLGVIRIRTAW